MKVSTYTLVTLGVILASLAFYFQKYHPVLSSIPALIGAFLFIKAANRLHNDKKALKAQKNKSKIK